MFDSSSIEIPNYFECFTLHTLRVFNALYASLHTVLYEPLIVFTHLYRHTVICGPLTVFAHLYRHTVIYGPLTVFVHLYRHTVIYGLLTVFTHLYTLFFMVLEKNNNNPVISGPFNFFRPIDLYAP